MGWTEPNRAYSKYWERWIWPVRVKTQIIILSLWPLRPSFPSQRWTACRPPFSEPNAVSRQPTFCTDNGKRKLNHYVGIKSTRVNVHLYSSRSNGSTRSISKTTSSRSRKKSEAEAVTELEKDAFYVVRKGDIVGVYKNFSDCQAQLSSSVNLHFFYSFLFTVLNKCGWSWKLFTFY